MPRKKQAAKTEDGTPQRARRIFRKLRKRHPDAECALEHGDPWQLLVATILSAQCTDERVNMVTPVLFKKYTDAAAMARAKQADVEKIIHSTGFFRSKAKALISSAKDIVERFDGRVPDTMQDLLSLHGVARKTANVVLGNAYGVNVGVVVDTHVKRLANRIGFTKHDNPQKIEQDLMIIFPRKDWALLSHLLIWHGRRVCTARKPDCANCTIRDDCPKIGVPQAQAV